MIYCLKKINFFLNQKKKGQKKMSLPLSIFVRLVPLNALFWLCFNSPGGCYLFLSSILLYPSYDCIRSKGTFANIYGKNLFSQWFQTFPTFILFYFSFFFFLFKKRTLGNKILEGLGEAYSRKKKDIVSLVLLFFSLFIGTQKKKNPDICIIPLNICKFLNALLCDIFFSLYSLYSFIKKFYI